MPRLWPALLVTKQRSGVGAYLRAVGHLREWRQKAREGRVVSNLHHGADTERGEEPGKDEEGGDSGKDVWMCGLGRKQTRASWVTEEGRMGPPCCLWKLQGVRF